MHSEESSQLSGEVKQLLCNVSAGMVFEATKMREKGLSNGEAKNKLEDTFIKNDNKTIELFLSWAVDYSYKLKDFNQTSNYTLWLSTCTIQLVKQNRDRIDPKYEYLDLVKEKVILCQNDTQPENKLDKCVLNIIMPALR